MPLVTQVTSPATNRVVQEPWKDLSGAAEAAIAAMHA
jgi:hypothetical protein